MRTDSLAPATLLACPVGMVAMMWFTSHSRGARDSASRRTAACAPVALDELRRRRADLDAAIGQREDAHGA